MSINVLLEIKAAEEKSDELIALFATILGDTRARPGCEGLTVHRDQDEPTTILPIERWVRREDYESNL